MIHGEHSVAKFLLDVFDDFTEDFGLLGPFHEDLVGPVEVLDVDGVDLEEVDDRFQDVAHGLLLVPGG